MARSSYQYETSPRKLEPEYEPRKKETKTNSKNKNRDIQDRQQELKNKKRMYHKNIFLIMGLFLMLLAVSYRNSLITEKFNEIQKQKSELSAIQKSNGQLEVSIEGSLNLNNVENAAKDKLGMQKLQNNQKVYVSLPKQDYTEAAVEEITEETESNWFMEFINSIFK